MTRPHPPLLSWVDLMESKLFCVSRKFTFWESLLELRLLVKDVSCDYEAEISAPPVPSMLTEVMVLLLKLRIESYCDSTPL